MVFARASDALLLANRYHQSVGICILEVVTLVFVPVLLLKLERK
jgi:hypothetical protein